MQSWSLLLYFTTSFSFLIVPILLQIVEVTEGGQLLKEIKPTDMFPGYRLECYPNRDSLEYRELYKLPDTKTFVRGTLRYEVRGMLVFLLLYCVAWMRRGSVVLDTGF